jgi:hypothetical protein
MNVIITGEVKNGHQIRRESKITQGKKTVGLKIRTRMQLWSDSN